QRAGVQSHLSNYSNRNRKPPNVMRGKAISSQPFFGLVSNRAEIIWFPIAPAHGTNNGQETTVVSTIQIPLTEATTFPQNSHRDTTHFTARFPLTTWHTRVIVPKHPALFRGSRKRPKAPPFLPAKIDGSPFERAIALP